MKHKILAALLAALLLITIFSGCGINDNAAGSALSSAGASTSAAPTEAEKANTDTPDEVSAESPEENGAIVYPLGNGDEKITLWTSFYSFYEDYIDSWNDANAIPALTEATGVELEYIEVSSTVADEKFSLMIASGDWPDLLPIDRFYSGGEAAAYQDGVILDLTDLLPSYAPDYLAALENTNNATKEAVTTEGKNLEIYTLMNAKYSDTGLVIRADWLQDLNADVPQTLNEFTDVLYAIREAYDTKYTFDFPKTGETSSYFAAAFDTQIPLLTGNADISPYLDGGSVVSALTSDGFRSYVEYVAKLYEDGIIHQDFYSDDADSPTKMGRIGGGQGGVWIAHADYMFEGLNYTDDPAFDVTAIPNLRANAGDPYEWSAEDSYARFGIAVSAEAEDPELTLKFLNYFYTEAGATLANYGVEDVAYTRDEDGNIQFTELILNNDQGLDPFDANLVYSVPEIVKLEYSDKMWSTYREEEVAAIQLWTETEGVSEHAIPSGAALTPEEATSVKSQTADVLSHYEETVLKFITGSAALDDTAWSDYVDTLISYGLDNVIAVYQNAYDEYIAGTR